MITLENYEEVKKSFHEYMKWTKEYTAQFAKDINLKTINEAILFCKEIINKVEIFYMDNSKNINNLSEKQEWSLSLYDNEILLGKGEILHFLSKNLLSIAYEEATVSENVNKFGQANIKENLQVVFDEYMDVNAYTIPRLKPYLSENINKKLTEKIDFNEEISKNVKM